MIKAALKYKSEADKVRRAAERGMIRALFKAAGMTRGAIRRLIKVRKKGKSSPGQPLFTHDKTAKNAVLFAVDKRKKTAVVGYAFSRFGEVGGIHEHGLSRFGRNYPARPAVGPGFVEIKDKINEVWKNSI